jgi:hypothetical protein
MRAAAAMGWRRTLQEHNLDKGADTNLFGFHCHVAKPSPLSSICCTSCFWAFRLSSARGAWKCSSPSRIGLAIPIGQEMTAAVVLVMDIILYKV